MEDEHSRPMRSTAGRRRARDDDDYEEEEEYDEDDYEEELSSVPPAAAAATTGTATTVATRGKRSHEDDVDDDEEYVIQGKKKKTAAAAGAGVSKPFRSRSGYMIYLQERTPDIRASEPGISLMDITRKVARIWKELPLDVKEQYNNRALEEKDRTYQALVQAALARGEDPPPYPGGKKSLTSTTTHFQQREKEETADYFQADPAVAASAATAAQAAVSPPDTDTYCSVCRLQFDDAAQKREHLETESHKSNIDAMKDTRRVKIFTDEFIAHHRSRESQLRALILETNRMEQSVKHLATQATDLQDAIETVRGELTAADAQRKGLLQRFEQLKTAIRQSGYPVPDRPEEMQSVLEQLNIKLQSASESDKQWAVGFAQRLAAVLPGTA